MPGIPRWLSGSGADRLLIGEVGMTVGALADSGAVQGLEAAAFRTSRSSVLAMVLLTSILLMLIGATLGLARRSWWEIGVLTLLACGSLQAVYLMLGDWRGELGLPHSERLFDPMVVGWLLIGPYTSYVLAFLYARWRPPTGTGSDR